MSATTEIGAGSRHLRPACANASTAGLDRTPRNLNRQGLMESMISPLLVRRTSPVDSWARTLRDRPSHQVAASNRPLMVGILKSAIPGMAKCSNLRQLAASPNSRSEPSNQDSGPAWSASQDTSRTPNLDYPLLTKLGTAKNEGMGMKRVIRPVES
jgi:hypothetical protein